MAISLSSVAGFNSTNLQGKYHYLPRSLSSALHLKQQIIPPSSISTSRKPVKQCRWGLCHSLADSNQLAAETNAEDSKNVEKSSSNNLISSVSPESLENLAVNNIDDKSGQRETSSASASSAASSDLKQKKLSTSSSQSIPKRSPLTARERLRAARVLSRYTGSKVSKSEMGSNVLDALRESDRGKKKSGLPEAPTNLFDDSKRGLPKQGLTFQFPGGTDLFLIVLSFVLISTVMFATTFLVWKVGAIHFNEN